MKAMLPCAVVLLLVSPLAAAPPTPIAFETIVSLDKFRITNLAESASIFQVEIRPSGTFTTTLSDPQDMWIADQPPWPGDDFTGWFLTRLYPGRWLEINGTPPLGAQLWVEFAEGPPAQQRGWIYATVQSGRFEGFTVPEPANLITGCILVAIAIGLSVWHYRRMRRIKRDGAATRALWQHTPLDTSRP